MKFNQLVDDAVEKFEVTQAVNFADLGKEAQLQAPFSDLQSEYNNYLNKLFFNVKEFTLCRLGWRDLIDSNYLKEFLIGIFGYPWYVLKEIVSIRTKFNFLQCFLWTIRSAFIAYNLKAF